MPGGRVGGAERLPASYANFYIGNTVVLVPVFGHPNDRIAVARIQQAFPRPGGRRDRLHGDGRGFRRDSLHQPAAAVGGNSRSTAGIRRSVTVILVMRRQESEDAPASPSRGMVCHPPSMLLSTGPGYGRRGI